MVFYKGKIAKQFIVRILLFSMVITTLLTGLQLYIDYKNGIEDIQENSKLIEISYLNSISNSLWNYDEDGLAVQLDGLYRLPDVEYIQVVSEGLKATRGEINNGDIIAQSFALNYNFLNEDRVLGEMLVHFSLDNLYQRLFDKAVIILVTQGIKTFLVSFFIFYIFYNLVGRFIGDISNYAKNINESTLSNQLLLNRSGKKNPDEIDDLVSALNKMRQSFISYKDTILSSQNELEYIAMHDPLTDLPNRVLLKDRADLMIIDAKRGQYKVALLYFDLDGFKQINDAHGHDVGDKVLIYVAELIQQNLRKSDTFSRLSGDEFVALIRLEDDVNSVAHLANKLSGLLSHPFKLQDINLIVQASIGVSIYPDDGDKTDLLLRHADAAMYKAKQQGRNKVQFYRAEFSEQIENRVRLEHELDDAVKNNELVVYFQPQINAREHKIIGAEALVRWVSPSRGFISPADFIPFAEQTGQIAQIDNWVLNKVASTVAQYETEAIQFPKISVNFSSKEFDQLPLSEIIQKVLVLTDCPAQKIEIELTESALMDDPVKCAKELEKIQQLGMSIAIDDFGTGYSSLSYLKFLPISKLKIDQAFIRDLENDANDKAIVKAIIALGESMDLELIAEGVETQQQLSLLKELGCDQIQGYFFSRPLPENEFVEFLKTFEEA